MNVLETCCLDSISSDNELILELLLILNEAMFCIGCDLGCGVLA